MSEKREFRRGRRRRRRDRPRLRLARGAGAGRGWRCWSAASPAAGATRVAAGMLAPVGELTFGEPELLELTLAAARLYPEFVAELEAATGESTGYERLGALHVALDRDEAAQLRRVHDLQRSLELEAEWLPPRALPRPGAGADALVPRRRPRGGRGGGRPAGADAGAARGVRRGGGRGPERDRGRRRHLRRRAARRGADREVDDDAEAPNRLDEEIRAETVVLAGGAWSGATDWLPEEARPPVRPVKGRCSSCAAATASRRRATSSPPSASTWCRAPTAASSSAPPSKRWASTPPSPPAASTSCCARPTACSPRSPRWSWSAPTAGLRPGTPDNLPLVGPGAIDGLVLATGHYRNGILLAPLAAQAVADLLPRDRRSSFRPP